MGGTDVEGVIGDQTVLPVRPPVADAGLELDVGRLGEEGGHGRRDRAGCVYCHSPRACWQLNCVVFAGGQLDRSGAGCPDRPWSWWWVSWWSWWSSWRAGRDGRTWSKVAVRERADPPRKPAGATLARRRRHHGDRDEQCDRRERRRRWGPSISARAQWICDTATEHSQRCIDLVSTYSSRPYLPRSRPMPDCL